MTTFTTQDVFVYGSLLEGLHNAELLGDAEILGEGYAAGEFEMVSFESFPGIYRRDGGRAVLGEAYRVDAETMRRLDRLESNGSFYQRERVRIELLDGEVLEAWVYLLKTPSRYADLPVVPGNDWRRHLELNGAGAW